MNKKQISLNIIGLTLSFVCTTFVSFFVSPYVVKNLGAEAYGYVGLANNFIGYFNIVIIAITGMLSRHVTVQYSQKNYEEASGFFSTAFFAQLILAIVALPPVALLCSKMDSIFEMSEGIVPDVKLLWALTFLSFLLGLSFGGYNSAVFAKNKLDVQSVISIVKAILYAAILLVMFIFYTPKVWYIGLAAIVSNMVNIVLMVIAKRKLTPEIKLSIKYFKKEYVRELVVVGIWNSVNRLQQTLSTGLDLLLTNIFINGNEMGLLSIAKTLPGICTTMTGTISSAFDPTLTITYGQGNQKQFVKQVQFAMKVTGFLCSIPILGIGIFGLNFYELWQPTLTDAEIQKVQILACLTLMQELFAVYVYPLATVNLITCKLKLPALVNLGAGILNIGIVFLLLKTTSLGVYAIAGVSSVLWSVKMLTFTPIYAAHIIGEKKSVFFQPLIKGFLNILFVGLFMYAVSRFFHASGWIEFIILVGLTALFSYLICFFIQFNTEERKKILQFAKSKIPLKTRNENSNND